MIGLIFGPSFDFGGSHRYDVIKSNTAIDGRAQGSIKGNAIQPCLIGSENQTLQIDSRNQLLEATVKTESLRFDLHNYSVAIYFLRHC